MEATFFKNALEFRDWLEKNYDKTQFLWLGYYKKKSGKENYTWSESVDQALCFGWIDGIRKSIDEERYMIRFTPRKPKSNWSAVNINKIKELISKNLMHEAGIKAFEKREENRSNVYSFEQEKIALSEEYESRIKKNQKAWEFFQELRPSLKKPSIWWVMSAKKEETRQRRLEKLIFHSEKGERLPQFGVSKKKNNK